MLISNKTIFHICVATTIVSLTLHLIFGVGLVLMKWLAYLLFAGFLVFEVRKFLRINKKATIIVITIVVAVSVSLQVMLGYGLGLLVWFAGLFAVYEVFPDIIKGLTRERNASE